MPPRLYSEHHFLLLLVSSIYLSLSLSLAVIKKLGFYIDKFPSLGSHQQILRTLTVPVGYFVWVISRGRPWRYSVIPSSPDFPTEYQIRRNSNPAGLPVFAAIWGPDFRASIIILTNMFKQIKQIRITTFKVYPSPANADLWATTRNTVHGWLM